MSTPDCAGLPDPGGEDASSFADFLQRVRAGDEAAAAELVRRYEPALRLEIRLRLTDPKLRRLLEPADLCQSVLGSFFLRAAAGQYDLDSSAKLLALLRAMARNKVLYHVRRQQAQRRDVRRQVSLDAGQSDGAIPITSVEPSPSRLAIGRELLEAFHGRLSTEERKMADLRAQGWDWPQIAQQLGGTPQSRRKQLARAVDRVAHDLGLDEADDDAD
jgi:RNA polymerase sigma-70 factor (ECF subfamily)